MLTTIERILFLLAVLVTLLLIFRAVRRIVGIIRRGHGKPDWHTIPKRIPCVLFKTISFSPVFRRRLIVSLFHAFVAWGFIYYLFVNIGDVLMGYIPGFHFLGDGWLGGLYRFGADLISVGVLAGMVALLVRRFLLRPTTLDIRLATLLHPKARNGIRRDSLIVGLFILLHVGARFMGGSFQVAIHGEDVWQPFASGLAGFWGLWSSGTLIFARHVAWWIALGSILAFFPYFPYSKHIHLFMAPLNFLLRPERRSMGELSALDFEDQQVEQYGAERLEDLSWSAFMDAYACIMCNRCQDACPAYETGKVLSPAALEINKRYFLNIEGGVLASGGESGQPLTQFAIPPEALWACTSCGACIDVCPVGNEPMQDILEIRRHLVLMENRFPTQLQTAYRGMERMANPWIIPPEERLSWAKGLHVPTIAERSNPEVLWWVGCAPATDTRAQNVARAFTKILQAANVDYAVLGVEERCTGDSARRSGNEYLFYELAKENVARLNEIAPRRIVTTCPHCLHTIKNEYPAFGGEYEVIHHTELLEELLSSGRLKLVVGKQRSTVVTFHDPCYLGRQNGIVKAPRNSLNHAGVLVKEMERVRTNSFCCGAGGAQMWKEEEAGSERISANRLAEAETTGVNDLAVGCPFCMIMISDAIAVSGSKMRVRDVVEVIADGLEDTDEQL